MHIQDISAFLPLFPFRRVNVQNGNSVILLYILNSFFYFHSNFSGILFTIRINSRICSMFKGIVRKVDIFFSNIMIPESRSLVEK